MTRPAHARPHPCPQVVRPELVELQLRAIEYKRREGLGDEAPNEMDELVHAVYLGFDRTWVAQGACVRVLQGRLPVLSAVEGPRPALLLAPCNVSQSYPSGPQALTLPSCPLPSIPAFY